MVYDRNTNAYLSSLTGMPQTKAVEPFKAPLDEEKIQITWPTYTDEWGNKFDDGETYELIYPEVKIPESAFYVPIECNNKPLPYADVEVRLESTIGIYGTGLLDAIDDADILAQYKAEEAKGVKLSCRRRCGRSSAGRNSTKKEVSANEPQTGKGACARPLER